MEHYSQHHLKVAATEPEHIVRKAELDVAVRQLDERLALLEQQLGGVQSPPVSSTAARPLAAPVLIATQTMSGPQAASLSLEWRAVPDADRYLVEWAPPGSGLWNELAIVKTTYYSYANYFGGVPLSYQFRVFSLSDQGFSVSEPSDAVLLTFPPHISLSLTQTGADTVDVLFNGGHLGPAAQVQLYHRYEGELGAKFQMIYSGLAASFRHTGVRHSPHRSLPYQNIYYIKILYPQSGIHTSYAVSEELGIDVFGQ